MIKQIIAIIVLSILITMSMPYMQQGLLYVVAAHDWVSETLKQVFSVGVAGNMVRALIALLVIPVGIGLIPVIGYWVSKRHLFPYAMQVIWVVWLMQAAALIVLFKGGV